MIIRTRRGSSAGWSAVNPVLDSGELGTVTDQFDENGSQVFKIGDGVTPWNTLPFAASGGTLQFIADGIGQRVLQNGVDVGYIGGVVF